MKNITTVHIDLIASFAHNVNAADFRDIFGERLGNHLWDELQKRDGDFLRFTQFLDLENLYRLRDAINVTSDESDEGIEPPDGNHLRWCILEHGKDLMNWPSEARYWLVSSPDAGDYIRKHAPGFLSEAAEAVGQWHQMSLLGLVNPDGTYDYFPW